MESPATHNQVRAKMGDRFLRRGRTEGEKSGKAKKPEREADWR